MKIVVTGSDGMLGHAVVNHFSKRNYNVVSLNKTNLNLESDNFQLNLGKINNIDYIIHCAAFTNVNESENKIDTLDFKLIEMKIL